MTLMLIAIFLSLAYGFLNGFNDASGIVATIISSRALKPRTALTLTSIAEFCGPLVVGSAVANTIASGIIDPNQVTLPVVISALAGAIIWGIIAGFLGIPSSSSHALVGGLIGSEIASAGVQAINSSGLTIVLIVLFSSPIIGLIAGFLTTKLIYFLAQNASMRIHLFFKKGQILTCIILGLSHGANDAQKTMGLLTLILVITGRLSDFQIPTGVKLISAAALALGVSGGGERLIRTLGGKFYKIRPVNGFATQLSAATVILTTALIGSPVSTSQVISSAILGVGSAERLNKVRWGVALNVVITWILTIPIAALISIILFQLISLIL